MPQGAQLNRTSRRVDNGTADVTSLFRDRAVAGKRHRLPGSVSVILPPAASHILFAAFISLGLLAAALYLIEIPLRSRAVGVLMPPGGVLEVASTTHGRVKRIAVAEGDAVSQGQILIEMSSDRGSTQIPSLAASELASLESELAILARKRAQNETLYQAAASDVAARVDSLSRRRELATKEAGLIFMRLELLAERVNGLEHLAAHGGIALDRLAQSRTEYLAAQREQLGAEASNVDLDLELQQLVSLGERTALEGLILGLESDAERERLERQRSSVSVASERQILAPRSGKIVRVGVDSGAVVAAGRPLLTLAADGEEWEAWLYVSATEAGLLEPGQNIELRLDAYPHQLYGTIAAEITSVTRLAVFPKDVRVPVAITGAVFEVRAGIAQSIDRALGAEVLPGIGASFTADIIKQRYRLYDWFLRGRSPLDPRAEASVVKAIRNPSHLERGKK